MNSLLKEHMAILCEDIRQELGNRQSLMGVYAGDILVVEFPATIRLTMFASLKFREPGTYSAKLRVVIGKEKPNSADIQIEQSPSGPAVIMLPAGMLHLDEPSEFRVDIAVEGAKWQRLVATKVLLAPPGTIQPA